MTHILEQETDNVHGWLSPKIDNDTFVDESFMPAMPGVSEPTEAEQLNGVDR